MTSPIRNARWRLALAALVASIAAPVAAQPPSSPDWSERDIPPDGYMMVVAYGQAGEPGESEVARWSGAIDLRVRRPTRYIARRTNSNTWVWSPPPPGLLHLNAPDRQQGGQPIHLWAADKGASRVMVIVVAHPGKAEDGASQTGLGTRGDGRGRDHHEAAPLRDIEPGNRPVEHITDETPAGSEEGPEETPGEDSTDETSTDKDSTGPNGIGQASAIGNHSRTRGAGAHANGRVRGRASGSESSSWVSNPRAEIAVRGGRTPGDGGRAGGSASGEAGGKGHANGAGWLNLLDVPESVAPAIAVAVIVFEADVMGFGQKLCARTVRGMTRAALDTEVGRQARAVVKRRAQEARRRMKGARPEAPPVEHLDEIMDYVPEHLEEAFYRDLSGLARDRMYTYQAVVAGTRDATDEVSKHASRLARENLAAWREIEDVCAQRMRGTTHADVATSGPGTAPAAVPPASAAPTAIPGARVRTPTAVSTPAHTVVRKGGRGPVLTGLRGEARVRAVHNIGPRKMIRINGRRRIPDGVTDEVLTEVKNVKKLSFTHQLRDYLDISQKYGLSFDLFVRRDTRLSEPLKEMLRNEMIQLRYIP